VPGHAPAPAYRLRPDRLFRPCVTQPASIDIAIEDSSETGCLIYAPSALPVGTQIAVGIPGLRRWRAVVRRIEGRRVGCAFVKPISVADVTRARSHETVVLLTPPAPAAPPMVSLLDPPSAQPALIDEVRGVAGVWEGHILAHPPRRPKHTILALIAIALFTAAIIALILK
jgi:hypothetical protein